MQSSSYAMPLQATTAAATVENPFKGWCDILVVPELSASPNLVYFIDATKSVRPFIHQVRNAAEFTTRQDPSDPKVFDLDTFSYGVRLRDAVGVSLPFLCARYTIS
jgi:phage major head subunit gpT-like protein